VNLLDLSFFGVFHDDSVIKLMFKSLLSDYPPFLKLLRWSQIVTSLIPFSEISIQHDTAPRNF
jgi:hypothetical protein